MRGKNRNDEIKAAVERKEAIWKDALGAKHEAAKERHIKPYKGENRKVEKGL